MMKRLFVLMLILAFALSGAACFAEEQPSGRPGGLTGERGERPAGDFPGGERGGNRGGGSVDKSGDEALQAMIAEVMPKFQLLTYTDEQTGTQLAYQLYTPEGYDASQRYPLIMFIPDSSAVGRGTDVVLSQGWGGLIWATQEELGTTLSDGTDGGAAGEHMTSFDYAYKLEAVRDWLFEQSK